MSTSSLGKGSAKRRRRLVRDTIQGITKPAIKRLAERAGVLSLNGLCYEETRGIMKYYLENIMHDAIVATKHRRARTVSPKDVLFAFEQRGINIVYSSESDKPKHKKVAVVKVEK